MGINSISQFQRWNNNYNLIGAMNSVNNRGAMSGTRGSQYQPVTPVSRTQKVPGSLSSDSLAFVTSYQKNMSGLMAAANKLKEGSSGSVTGDMTVSSSNAQVADASASWTPSQAASYTLDVQQAATAQTNISDAVSASGTELSGDLTIQTGAGTVNTFRIAAGATNNADALNTLAKEINKAAVGVTANVSLKDGKASLSLIADKTGESSAFQVSGSLADSTGLADPYTKAQNAIFTVKEQGSYAAEKKVTSESNSVYVDGNYRIKAQIKGAGKTTIGVAPDMAKTADAVQNLVEHHNSTLKLLNDNADRGVGVLNQMKRLLTLPTSEKSMNKIGLTSNKDGTLSFDRATFAKASSENPSLVKGILSGSYGVANGYYNDAQRGLRTSSNSLLSEDMKTAKLEAAYSPMNYATYNRNGAFTSNAGMNVLMNMMV